MARILAVPLVPFVAAWEGVTALAGWLPVALRWVLARLGSLFSLVFRGIASAARAVARLVSAIGRGVNWVAGQAMRVVSPVLVRAWVLTRALVSGLWHVLHTVVSRIAVPLRVVARAVWALVVRAGMLVRAVARAIWIALRAAAVRIAVPLRLLARAFAALMARVATLARAVARGIWTALRAIGARLVIPLRLLLRGLAKVLRAALLFVRAIGHVISIGWHMALEVLTPIAHSLWRVIAAAAHAAWSAIQLAWRPVRIVLHWAWIAISAPFRIAWRLFILIISAISAGLRVARAALAYLLHPAIVAVRWAAHIARTTVVEAAHTVRGAGHAARLAIHDLRNGVRHAMGRPPLPYRSKGKPERHVLEHHAHVSGPSGFGGQAYLDYMRSGAMEHPTQRKQVRRAKVVSQSAVQDEQPVGVASRSVTQVHFRCPQCHLAPWDAQRAGQKCPRCGAGLIAE